MLFLVRWCRSILELFAIVVGTVVVAVRINDRRTRDDTHHHSPKQAQSARHLDAPPSHVTNTTFAVP